MNTFKEYLESQTNSNFKKKLKELENWYNDNFKEIEKLKLTTKIENLIPTTFDLDKTIKKTIGGLKAQETKKTKELEETKKQEMEKKRWLANKEYNYFIEVASRIFFKHRYSRVPSTDLNFVLDSLKINKTIDQIKTENNLRDSGQVRDFIQEKYLKDAVKNKKYKVLAKILVTLNPQFKKGFPIYGVNLLNEYK